MSSYRGVHLFPVRHHSPRTGFVLERLLDRVQPQLVLVEGPEDAEGLVDAIVDPETRPPVAILGYRTDGTPASALWPFAAYSPEYVALRWSHARGRSARFIDITTGQSLARDRETEAQDGAHEIEVGDDAPAPALQDRIAALRGFRSFEEFWEASFEAPDYDERAFRDALLAYADLIRHDGPRVHRARDAHMAKRIEEAIAAGADPSRTVAVLGAAHAAALAAGDVDETLLETLTPTVSTAVTLVPYSFPRLAEQTGYGAGNRAPQYYQRAWDAGLSFRRATLEVLVDFTDHLRLRGFTASLADTIEAYRLACMLADLRGKGEPGLDEVREATVATMCRGDATHVDGFLWSSVVGKKVGQVASRIGRNSLQDEFWREVGARRLPATDAPEEFVLKRGDPLQVASSIFLHRLRVADVPYAVFRGTAGRAAPEEAGGVGALGRVKEAWQAQWTPATDVALIERIVLGDTLAEVCERALAQRLAEATATGAAAGVLLEAVVVSAPRAAASALSACDRLAAVDDDLPSLARACRALSGLVSYGTSRAAAELGDEAIPALCRKTFVRAVLRVRAATAVDDAAVPPANEALRVLHEIALAQPLVDGEAWLAAARALTDDDGVHPSCAGVAAGLLYLAQRLGEDELTTLVQRRLSNLLEPERGAAFLSGFLEVNALVLVKNRTVVQALDAFLAGIDRERFRDSLPVLRRAFSPLGATERRYLAENIVALRKLQQQAPAVAQVLQARDKEQLAQLGADLSKAMDDLDDLL